MANIIEVLEKQQARNDLPEFRAGDTLRVHCKIKEGAKERIQAFEGVCIAKSGQNGSVKPSFRVRKMSFGVGVERAFPLNSPRIEKIEVLQRGQVRRAKLYYLRDLTGKAARIKEKQYRGNTEAAAA